MHYHFLKTIRQLLTFAERSGFVEVNVAAKVPLILRSHPYAKDRVVQAQEQVDVIKKAGTYVTE